MYNEYKKPTKQGGQSNGPYLQKDIMQTNMKSNSLINFNGNQKGGTLLSAIGQSLVFPGQNAKLNQNALQLNEPADYYDEKLQAYTNFDEKYKAKSNAAENISINQNFLSQGVELLHNKLQIYKDQIINYRKDLEQMHEQIHNSNMNNIREIQPMLKDFHQRLKDNLHADKNENYKLQRELETLNREKLQIQQQILFSHKRIMDLEKLIGIQHTNIVKEENEENQQDDQDEDEDEVSDFDND